jgi:hypothetical protein
VRYDVGRQESGLHGHDGSAASKYTAFMARARPLL